LSLFFMDKIFFSVFGKFKIWWVYILNLFIRLWRLQFLCDTSGSPVAVGI
jgi:hypothetical protein